MEATVTESVSLTGNRDLQISGWTNFSENRWREAILFYLFGIWSEKEDVVYRPKIHFGTMCLCFDEDAGRYFAYGASPDWEVPQDLGGGLLITEGCGRDEVEMSLVRFVKNDRIRILVISFGGGRYLRLWKDPERRGKYGCHGTVPHSLSTARLTVAEKAGF